MRYINKTSLSLALISIMGYLSMYNSSGSYTSNGGRTGASFDNGTCVASGCHVNGSFSPTTTLQLLDGTTAVTSYTSNHNYTLRITITSSGTSSSTRYGFQAVSVQNSSNNNINGWGSMPTGTKTVTISGRTYASHSTRLTTNVINIPWTSPATSTGTIKFYASGLVANGNFQQSGDNVATASLTITTGSSGCSTPTITPSITHIDCNGDNTGAISISTTGGTTPFTYSWTGPGGFSSGSRNISGLAAGQYRLILTANGGCKDTIYATVNQPPPLVANASSNSPYCIGDNISMSANGSGGTGAITYSWVGPGGFSSSSATPSITPAAFSHNGKYIVTLRDIKNCTILDTVDIQVDSMPQIDSMVLTELTNNTFSFSMANPRFVNSQSWTFGDGLGSTLAGPNHTYITNGVFNVELVISNHCGNDTFKTTVSVWPVGIANTKHGGNLINIFPNPSNTHFNINAQQGNTIKNVYITSIEGVVVYQQKINGLQNLKIDASTYPSGLYILHVNTDKGDATHQLNIIH